MEARPDTLAGLPIGIKDVVATEGFPTQCGTRLPPSVISQLLGTAEAECAEILKRAGAIIAGKTVTAELATYQPGATVNPLSVDRTPGGSSSGSAAAVAAGDVRLALATQTRVYDPACCTVECWGSSLPTGAMLCGVCSPPRRHWTRWV